MEDVIVYDWDSEDIEVASSEFTLLPEGTYPFEIVGMERERFEGSDKMPACPRANVKLRIDGRMTMSDRIMLTSKFMWKAKRLFEAVGLADPDVEQFTPKWNMLEGKTGFVRIKVREYQKNGDTKQTNDIDFYYRPLEIGKAVETYQREQLAQDAQNNAAQAQNTPVSVSQPVQSTFSI